MAPAGKVTGFYREGNDWFCTASLVSDVTLVVDGVNFHLHKFPLMSRCGRIAKILEAAQGPHEGNLLTTLEDFPGGSDIFLVAVKFCYSIRVDYTPRNIVMIYCAADYLEMTEEYGEDNLLLKADAYFHKNTIRNWKDCILALQTCDPVIPRADKLEIISKCLNALSVMVCTDPSLFGWPMLMYGSLQSPGGSILWNGINTGARIQTIESDWWFEDISYLSVPLFQRLIQTMEARGIRHENLAGAMMYYCRKYLPGLGRWQSGQSGKTRTVASFSMTPAAVDQKVLLESVVKLLPELKGKSFCRFLLGLLRVALILGVNHTCQDSLERRIGMQLDLASLDGLLIPSYSDSDTLYHTDSVERMIHHFISSEPGIATTPAPSSFEIGTSPSSDPLRRVAKLVDSYIAEVASDVNLKPGKIRSLAEALPESSRSLHDGLYRAIDIYFKGSAWPLGLLMRHCSMLRNRMLADPSFLFKVGTEIVIDSCCATFAEVQKRGKDFWAEFELYAADLLVGIVVDVALVGMLAPYVRIGKQSISSSSFGRFRHACGALPSSVFEAERPGCKFTLQQRIATYFYKGFLYGSVGFGCGLIGQGIANLIMTAKRSIKKSEEDIPVPPLIKSAALWGFFLAVSSNTRYQIINGLERLVEASPVAKRVPPVAMAFTVGVRFANNIYGGMQFVEWAKVSGVQ